MNAPRILIAGIGNIFLGDDAFGVEVVRELAGRSLPDSVRVVDFGIRGMDLAFALLDDYEAAILIDAAPRGEAPGTLYVIEPDAPSASEVAPAVDMHSMDPVKVLRLAASIGTPVRRVLVVGCEPGALVPGTDDPEDMHMGLTPAVGEAVSRAIPLVESLIAKVLDEIHAAAGGVPVQGS